MSQTDLFRPVLMVGACLCLALAGCASTPHRPGGTNTPAELAEIEMELAEMYRTGSGVERDLDEAEKWYSMAAARGYPQAKELLEMTRQEKARERQEKERKRVAAVASPSKPAQSR